MKEFEKFSENLIFLFCRKFQKNVFKNKKKFSRKIENTKIFLRVPFSVMGSQINFPTVLWTFNLQRL